MLDTEKLELVVFGSSARMLSREVHTSLPNVTVRPAYEWLLAPGGGR